MFRRKIIGREKTDFLADTAGTRLETELLPKEWEEKQASQSGTELLHHLETTKKRFSSAQDLDAQLDGSKIDESLSGEIELTLVGRKGLPEHISIPITPGECFSIGRFDVSLGVKEQNYEFDQKTHGISRHHAVISQTPQGEYNIMDCWSRFGTYVNGKRLEPEAIHRLNDGDIVSFGNSGAEYIFRRGKG